MKAFLRVLAFIGTWAHSKLIDRERREAIASALPRGSVVTLSKCKCPYNHDGLWRIDEYIPDANDYRIIRISDGTRDFAGRSVMEVVGADDPNLQLCRCGRRHALSENTVKGICWPAPVVNLPR